MNFITGICKRIFGHMIHLYPAKFQYEYGEELQSDFDSLLEEARSISGWEFLAVCLRELRDLPINLLRTHFEEKWMYRILHSQSLRFGWKGALTFGLSFVVVNVLDGLVNTALVRFAYFHFQVLLMENPAQQIWAPIFNMADNMISWMVASIVGGFLFAALFTGKYRFSRFAGLGIIGFLVPGLIYRGLMFSAYINFPWFSWAMEAISGLFLGGMIALLAEAHPRKIALVGAGAILYPCLVESSFRLYGALFPPASPLFITPAESYRQVILGFMVAGLFFGLLMGLMLGWGRKTNVAKETNNSIRNS
jgi:hypothetical protein